MESMGEMVIPYLSDIEVEGLLKQDRAMYTLVNVIANKIQTIEKNQKTHGEDIIQLKNKVQIISEEMYEQGATKNILQHRTKLHINKFFKEALKPLEYNKTELSKKATKYAKQFYKHLKGKNSESDKVEICGMDLTLMEMKILLQKHNTLMFEEALNKEIARFMMFEIAESRRNQRKEI